MPLQPVEFPGFEGLEFRQEAQLLGPGRAVDAFNVMFDQEGRVRTRYGLTSYITLGGVMSGGMFLWPRRPTTDRIVLVTAAAIGLYNSTGGLVGSTAVASGLYADAVAFGTPAASVMYLIESSSLKQLDDVGAQTAVGGAPTNLDLLAVQTPDNRLVAAQKNAGVTNTYRVLFSGAGTPTTFAANDFVDLEPGDSDDIKSLVSWNNQIFAFKSRKFYVFYGNSVDGAGNSVFNYRRVAGSVGVVTPTTFGGPKGAVAAPDGVYFIGDGGVYRTTGGPAVKISAALDPIFQFQTAPPYFTGATGSSIAPKGIYYSDGKVYVHVFTTTGRSAYFVYDIGRGAWTYWEIPSSDRIVFADYTDSAGSTRRMFVGDTTSASVRVMTPAATSDNGTAIVSRYRSGFWNPGLPGSEADVFEWLLDGTGTVSFQVATNDASTLGTAATVTLGTSPAVTQGRDTRAVWGRNLSWQAGASSGQWALSRVIANVASQTQTGFKAA